MYLWICTGSCRIKYAGNIGEYLKDGCMAAGSFLFLKEQIKGIIIIWYALHACVVIAEGVAASAGEYMEV
jgi:hypothetical protein